MVDADGVPEPAGLSMALDPEACAEHVLGLLPEPFHDASCVWQASASAGIRPGCRLHLWFRLSRPVTSGQAKAWLRGSPVDRTIYTPVQPHYTADPVFLDGVYDPVRRRRGLRRGLEDLVEVPDGLEEAPGREVGPVGLTGRELTDADLAELGAALRRSRAARQILGRRSPLRRSEHVPFRLFGRPGPGRAARPRPARARARGARPPARRRPEQGAATRLRRPHGRRRPRPGGRPVSDQVADALDEAATAAAQDARAALDTGDDAFAQAILALAALPRLDYQRQRLARAKELGVRAPVLDAAVRAARMAAGEEQQRSAQRDELVAIGMEAELWHDDAHQAYASIRVDGHVEHHRLRSTRYRRLLVRLYGDRHPVRGPNGAERPGCARAAGPGGGARRARGAGRSRPARLPPPADRGARGQDLPRPVLR